MQAVIRNLVFERPDGAFRLRIPSLDLASGSRVAFVGPSGSGKTTLLRLLAGILTPSAGDITLGDVTINQLSDRERRRFRITQAGFVFQDFELLDYLNARENILLPYRINPAMELSADVSGKLETLADELGVRKLLDRPVTCLSQGEQQRVAICRALLPGPKLIFADEPTGNLDPQNRDRIRDILFDRAKATGATLAVVTHDHSLLDGFDQVVDFAEFGKEAG